MAAAQRNAAAGDGMGTRLFRGVCYFAGAHPDVALESNRFDQATIAFQAFALTLATVLAVVAWGAFFATFLPVLAALPLGLLVALFVYSIDRAIVASDWTLAGVLADGPPSRSWWGKVAFRIAFAWVLAQATAAGAVLWLFAGAIETRLQQDRAVANAPLYRELEAKLQAERDALLGPVQTELAALQRERDALQQETTQTVATRNGSRALARTAANEAGRELDGYGDRLAGAGPRWREALRAEENAQAVAQEAEQELAANRARLAKLTPAIEARTQEAQQLAERLGQREAELRTGMVSDPRWVQAQRDPLSAWIGLAKLKAEPEYGAAAQSFDWLMTLVLFALELSVLFVKIAFAPPSVYLVRLIARTKREAVEAAGAEADATRAALHRHRPRGHLHLVNDPNPPPDQ